MSQTNIFKKQSFHVPGVKQYWEPKKAKRQTLFPFASEKWTKTKKIFSVNWEKSKKEYFWFL